MAIQKVIAAREMLAIIAPVIIVSAIILAWFIAKYEKRKREKELSQYLNELAKEKEKREAESRSQQRKKPA